MPARTRVFARDRSPSSRSAAALLRNNAQGSAVEFLLQKSCINTLLTFKIVKEKKIRKKSEEKVHLKASMLTIVNEVVVNLLINLGNSLCIIVFPFCCLVVLGAESFKEDEEEEEE